MVVALLVAVGAFFALRRRKAETRNAAEKGYGGLDDHPHGMPHESSARVGRLGLHKQPTQSSLYGGSTYASSNYPPSEMPISPEQTSSGPNLHGYEMQHLPGSEANPQELPTQRNAAELPAVKDSLD